MSLPVTFPSFLLQPWGCMAGSLKKPRYTTNPSPTHWLSTAYLCNPLFLLSNSAFNHQTMATLQCCDFHNDYNGLGLPPCLQTFSQVGFDEGSHHVGETQRVCLLSGALNSQQGSQFNSPQGTQSSQQLCELTSGYSPS